MLHHSLAAFAALLLLAACAASRTPVEDVVQPLPAGITPLTVEQDRQIAG